MTILRRILLKPAAAAAPRHAPESRVIELERIALEELIELKLSQVLKRLDIAAMHDLHQLIMPRLERPLIKMALERLGGNQLRAAQVLGINRNTLRRKIRELHIGKSRK